VAHFFSALVSERPLVIVLDDLQWADSATMELLGYLILRAMHAAPAAGAQPLFILLYRADEVDAEHPLRNLLTTLSRCDAVDELRLRRLSADAIQQLLVNIADQPIPLVCANEMYRYTEGNPFFIVEALLAMVQEGKIQRVEERWQKMVPIEELELPQSLRLLIERRLMHFSSECHITLMLAAVLGRHFNSAILSRACALPEEVVAEHID